MKINQGYRQTDVGKIPEEWGLVRLGDLIIAHKAGIYKKRKFYGTGYNIVGVADLYYHNAIDGQIFRQVKLTPEEYAEYSLKEGDLIYGESSLVYEGIGKTLVVTSKGAGTAFAWHTRRFRVDRTKVNPFFLHHMLNAEDVRKSIMKRATRTAITGITVDEFFKTKLPLPRKTEQAKIASILSTIDEAMKKTDEVIRQAGIMKRGLVESLLTRGIGYTQFKQTELEEIPEEWEIVRLRDLISIKHGYAFKSKYFGNKGPIMLTPGNFTEYGGLYFNERNLKRYSGSYPKEFVFSPGDLVVVMTDLSPLCKILGNPAIIPTEERVLHNQRLGKIIFKSLEIDKNFLYYCFLSNRFKKPLRATATGSTVRHTSPDRILNITFPLPRIPEQQKIASILSTIDEKIEKERRRKEQLEKLKKGLMQDLLAGRVRVRVD